MKFSTRASYGLRAMIILAKNKGKTISLPCISQSEGISLGYLEGIFAKLKKAGLVGAEKGALGGYELAKDLDKVSVFDIIRAVEGDFAPFYCVDGKDKHYCSEECKCHLNKSLLMVKNSIKQTLKEINLSQLV